MADLNRVDLTTEHTHLTVDVVKGRGSGFSVEAPEGVRFLIRSRLLTDEELGHFFPGGYAPGLPAAHSARTTMSSAAGAAGRPAAGPGSTV